MSFSTNTFVPINSRWQHYKGGIYKVHAVGLLESTGEEMVIYHDEKSLNGYLAPWIRPLREWTNLIEYNGAIHHRFKRLPDNSEEPVFTVK